MKTFLIGILGLMAFTGWTTASTPPDPKAGTEKKVDAASEADAKQEASLEEKWWQGVSEILKFTAKAEEGNATLNVELYVPAEKQIKELKDPDGTLTGYSMDGKKMPERFWPGSSLIKKFELVWDGKPIEIPKRFWEDLAGFTIQSSSLEVDKLPSEQQAAAAEFLENLTRPHVSISADGGTILIEWERGEECDGHSVIRWMITKGGVVLRHRHTPPHEC